MGTHYVESRPPARRGWQNVGRAERVLSIGAGAGLALAALWLKNRHARTLAVTGASMALRGAAGWCPVYAGAGVNRAGSSTTQALGGPRGVNVQDRIVIRRDTRSVYEFWRQLENLPSLMEHLESVVQIDPIRSHWVARGPFGLRVEWDAEIINEIPNRLLAWRSLEGADMVSAGSVRFRDTPRGTEVIVTLQYSPPAGKAGAALGWFFGETPAQELREGLRRLRDRLEQTRQSESIYS
jgi:uncharacterized membrane protein